MVSADGQEFGKSAEIECRSVGISAGSERSAAARIRKSVFEPWTPWARQHVEVLGHAFEFGRIELFVRKRPEMIAQAFECRGYEYAQQFLPDRRRSSRLTPCSTSDRGFVGRRALATTTSTTEGRTTGWRRFSTSTFADGHCFLSESYF